MPKIKIAFASGTDDLNRALIASMRDIFPELPLWVVSDFPPEEKDLRWIPWHSSRTLMENLALARAAVKGNTIRLAGVMLVPNVPFRRMRLMALLLSPRGFLAFNENLSNFMLRPGSALAIPRHFIWRTSNLVRAAARAVRETDWKIAFAAVRARMAARLRPRSPRVELRSPSELEIFSSTVASTGGYVLCGAPGATSYNTEKRDALLGAIPPDSPMDLLALELGYRAWQRGWPSVSTPGGAATGPVTLPPADRPVDAHYLSFLARTVHDPGLFRNFWEMAIDSLAASRSLDLLRQAAAIGRQGCTAMAPSLLDEASFLALTNGSVAIFEGRKASGLPRILVASPYLPFPLSHGGAVRMYNLMRRAARDFDQILICFTDTLQPPAAELLNICAEVILVHREGSHALPSRGRPDTVEEFDLPAFRAALRLAVRKWHPVIAQLEFTQMAQYAPDCALARTLLIEHDVTLDLYQQMLAAGDDWEVKRQLALWQKFEKAAWRKVDRVVLMSEKDRRLVAESGSCGVPVTLPNGVDLDRFRPSGAQPEPRRILFIGSFAHLPNLMALEFFLREVWPALQCATLHIISGANHEYYLDYYRDCVRPDLTLPGIELEGFVSDVRRAYERAVVVVVPLVASAGTNIKVLEAMAMGKAVVSTAAGVNGLDLTPGEDFLLVKTGAEMAAAITGLFDDPAARAGLEQSARRTAEREYGWDAIAARQAALYRECAS